jgi:hypothetical protein
MGDLSFGPKRTKPPTRPISANPDGMVGKILISLPAI